MDNEARKRPSILLAGYPSLEAAAAAAASQIAKHSMEMIGSWSCMTIQTDLPR